MIENLDYFIDKIKNYEHKYYTFIPFRLTFYMKAPICLSHPWMHLDSLIMHGSLKNILKDDFFLLPSKFPLGRVFKNRDDLAITPLKKYKDLYFASVSFFNNSEMRSETIYKKFEDRWNFKSRKTKLSKGSGYYKDYAMKMIYILSDIITFYGNGDLETIKEICNDIVAIGNDIRIGWGAIRDFKIEPIQEDWSIIADNRAMRPIPIKYLKSYDENDIIYLAWKSPYWASESVDLCVIPGSKIELKDELARDIFNS